MCSLEKTLPLQVTTIEALKAVQAAFFKEIAFDPEQPVYLCILADYVDPHHRGDYGGGYRSVIRRLLRDDGVRTDGGGFTGPYWEPTNISICNERRRIWLTEKIAEYS